MKEVRRDPEGLDPAAGTRLRARFDPEITEIERLELEAAKLAVANQRRTPSRGLAGPALAASIVVAALGISLLLASRYLPGEVGSDGPVVESASISMTSTPTHGAAVTPDLPTGLPPLGEAVLVIGYSDEYSTQAERDIEAPAALVVWDSGLIVGDPFLDGFRAVQLTSIELEDLRHDLLAANLITLSLPNRESASGRVVCVDCAVTIIRTDVSGETVEVAVWGLVLELRPGFEGWQTLPANVVRVGQVIEDVWVRVRADSAAQWAGDVPNLPISGHPTGG